jgi:hypothetical protein
VVVASTIFNWEVQEPAWVKVVDASGAEVDPGEYDWRTLYDPAKGTKATLISGVYHWYDYTNTHGDTYKYDIEVSATSSSICYNGSTVQAAFRIGAKQLAMMGEGNATATAVSYDTVQWEGQEWDFAEALADTSGDYIKIPYAGKSIKPTVKSIKYLGLELRIAADDWYNRPYDYDYIYIYGNPNPEESNQLSYLQMDVTPDDKPACMTVRHLTSSNFRNYVNVFFKIVPADIAGAITEPMGDRAYTGQAVEPEVRLTFGDTVLKKDTDYTLSYQNNTALGRAEIIMSGMGNLKGVKTLYFNIVDHVAAPIDINAANVSSVNAQAYTGKAIEPEVELTYGDVPLINGTDYTLSYQNNTEIGRAEIIVNGMGNYIGVKTIYFDIVKSVAPIDINSATISYAETQAYTGYVVEPDVRLAVGDKVLKKDTDYTISYRNNIEPGRAEIIVNGKGNYTGAKTLYFSIVGGAATPAEAPIDINAAAISSVKTQVYTGKALKPAVKLIYGGATLKNGEDYSLAYDNNTIPGKAEIVVTGAGKYAGAKTVYFNINPPKMKIAKLTTGKKKLTVKFAKPKAAQKATSMQLRYRQKGKSKWSTVNVSVKKSSYVIKKLKKSKKYQVQMRIVRTVKSGYAKGGYYGGWSATKTSKAVR